MPPAGVGGPPSRSASAIVADTMRGYHILRIDGYSLTKATPTGECIKSHPFTVGGHRWCIRYYPNGSETEVKDYISLFLHLVKTPNNEKEVRAQFQFRFVPEVPKMPSTSEELEVNIFPNKGGWGYRQVILRTELEESKHLKDDSFSVRCDIVVLNNFCAEEIKAEVTTPGLVPVPPSDLHQHLGDLLVTKKAADVVFQVGAETFAAHRCVLSARSPVFSAELFGTMMERDAEGVIRIEDMEPQVFRALLHFVYTDSLPKADKEEKEAEEDVLSQHLLVAADRYNLERLKLICEHKLWTFIDVGTVATILTLAEQHHCHGLKKACFGFLSSSANLKAAMATDGFDHLYKSCPSVMKELLAMPRS